jgi:hypothetical protein
MATTEKLSVTLSHEEVEWAREQARLRKMSFSAVVSEALRQARQFQARKEYLEWALEGQPPLTAAELEAAGRELEGASVGAPVQKHEDAAE